MPYSKFTLEELKKNFNLTFSETLGKFNNLPEVAPSQILQDIFKYYIPLGLAIGSEKAKSEFIIAPILAEIKQREGDGISLFSGLEFNVDVERGLNGFCDFIMSSSPEQLLIEAPVVTLVEAKNDNLKSGLATCIAEMVGAQIFNEREGNEITKIYGAVTNGTNWQFMELESQTVIIDLDEYYLSNLPKILGILSSFF
ncbi:MAG: hypothetical protein SXA11_25215 [Cyanobacteriota bacterium]|nr:hypothetical protein [Cyanobacteriota bacterium]